MSADQNAFLELQQNFIREPLITNLCLRISQILLNNKSKSLVKPGQKKISTTSIRNNIHSNANSAVVKV